MTIGGVMLDPIARIKHCLIQTTMFEIRQALIGLQQKYTASIGYQQVHSIGQKTPPNIPCQSSR